MKYLLIETIFNSPHLETSAEIAIDLKKKKNKVLFSWIGNDLPWSDWQLSMLKKSLGSSIEKKVNLIEEILRKNQIDVVTTNTLKNKINKKILLWSKRFSGSEKNLKKYSYRGQNLGIGVLSSMISYFHNSNLDTKYHRSLIIKSLSSSAIIYERTLNLIEKYKPETIVTFNNRFATSLPIILAAKKNKINVLRHERGSNFNKYEIFEEDIHDLTYRAKNVEYYWLKEKNLKKKIKIANSYFIKRREGIPLNWDMKKNYSINQSSGHVPVKKKTFRVVFYTASEDEHESTKFQLKNIVWPTQEIALKKLIQGLKVINNYELYIRVHPISEKRKSLYDQNKWMKYENKNNVHVIPYDSKVNSYELMDSADLIVTYGGNIGIEACYWGKNAISLRNGIYSKDKLIFEPKNFTELKRYLSKIKKSKIKDKKNQSLRYAYYFMVFGKRFKFFKCKSFDDCYYGKIQTSHLNKLLLKIKNFKKKIII